GRGSPNSWARATFRSTGRPSRKRSPTSSSPIPPCPRTLARPCSPSPEGGSTLADITMPQLGETVTEGTITKWLKQVGDQIAEDDVLFEVSTDKVDSEVPSPAAGYLAEILVPEGETVDVGTKLAVISAE